MQLSRRWKVLAVTAVAVFMGFLDVTIVNVAFPDIERDFTEASRADLSWVLNAYNIVFAALLVPAGRLADLLGRRRMFLIGVAAFVAASALCGLAPSPEWLVGARVVQAAAGAILVPTSLALLLPEFPPERRATAVAIWSATGAVAAALGPSLGGVLVDQAGWRWVFFLNVPIGLAALVPARRVLHEARDPDGVAARRARRRCCSWPAWARWRSASSRAPTGAGAARACWARWRRPRCCFPRSWCARRATARR